MSKQNEKLKEENRTVTRMMKLLERSIKKEDAKNSGSSEAMEHVLEELRVAKEDSKKFQQLYRQTEKSVRNMHVHYGQSQNHLKNLIQLIKEVLPADRAATVIRLAYLESSQEALNQLQLEDEAKEQEQQQLRLQQEADRSKQSRKSSQSVSTVSSTSNNDMQQKSNPNPLALPKKSNLKKKQPSNDYYHDDFEYTNDNHLKRNDVKFSATEQDSNNNNNTQQSSSAKVFGQDSVLKPNFNSATNNSQQPADEKTAEPVIAQPQSNIYKPQLF